MRGRPHHAGILFVILLSVAAGMIVWESRVAGDILAQAVAELALKQPSGGIEAQFPEGRLTFPIDGGYRILYHDNHLLWGQIYCVRLASGSDLRIDVFPRPIAPHRVTIKAVDSCDT